MEKKVNGVLDSVYFCVVTMTTVGYGDLVPNSAAARTSCFFLCFFGMALVGMVLSKGRLHSGETGNAINQEALHMRDKVGPSDILEEIETNKVVQVFFLYVEFNTERRQKELSEVGSFKKDDKCGLGRSAVLIMMGL
ncbi:Potassium channel [Datura stramonium]|uniref:Potassium channel n=1 Tax=Datura stramonium TaxID=4076 RepID=A0ABS8SBD4_DATST|nr:Potassium channel [Datura stramonium]